jgi:hypothetical protein
MTTFERLLLLSLIILLFIVVVWWLVGIYSIQDATTHGAAVIRGFYR